MHKVTLDSEKIRLMEAFFMNSTDGIYIVDKAGRVLLANPSILEYLGASYEELVGIKLASIIKSGVYRGSPVLETMRTKKVFTGLVKARNGAEIMSTSKPIFNDSGELELIITNCRPLRVIDSFIRQYYGNPDIKKKSFEEPYRPKLEKELAYKSSKMKKMMRVVDAVASTDSTIIIYGETGTGKGLIAQYIHEKSNRRNKRLVDINCAAIPENLIESELFGYEKGAFTGASAEGKLGLFEIAHEGTLFLDEIGEMPLHFQAKLLKVLDAGYVLRLGGTVYHKVNARVIVATNKNLMQMVKQGKFREDFTID
jgi:PAS domain S-box-containing protein